MHSRSGFYYRPKTRNSQRQRKHISNMLSGLIGGVLIGVSASCLMLCLGRIAGISGMLTGLFAGESAERLGRLLFLLGMIAAPLLLNVAGYEVSFGDRRSTTGLILAAGLLVGFGTRLGSGCTSGHGVCGLARLSPRSLAAVSTFLVTAMLTVYVMRHVIARVGP